MCHCTPISLEEKLILYVRRQTFSELTVRCKGWKRHMIEITLDDIVIIISRNKPSAEDRRKESLRFWTLANTYRDANLLCMESHCLWNSRHVRQNHHPKSIRINCICLYSLSLPLSLYDMLYFLKTWNFSCHFSSHSHADTFSYVWTQCLLTNLELRVYISFDKIHSWYCSKFYFVC